MTKQSTCESERDAKKMTVDQMYAKILSSGNGMIVNRLFKIIKGKPVLDSLSRSEPKKNNNNNLHYRSPFRQDIQVK